jgi:hypothetical protein
MYYAGQFKFDVTPRYDYAEPLTTTSVPYFYYPWFVPGAETFSATLGADITTAPAAGTVQTISIPDAATAPVFVGLRIVADSEVMRVIDVDDNDPTLITVVRGSERTTPATHSAGPIAVRYRLPNTDPVQTTIAGFAPANLHFTTQHKLKPGIWMSTPLWDDMNPLARINVTLTADVTTTSQSTFNVSTPDWTYLASGLRIKFDSEVVRVTAANQGAGTITVARNVSGGAATHTSGTVGVGRSACYFCQSQDDPTKFAWQDQTGYTQNFQVTGPKSLYMAIQVPLANPVLYGTQPFDPTPHVVNGVDQSLGNGVSTPGAVYPIELTAAITKQSPGAYHWFNLPYCGTDDFAVAAARTLRDSLPAGKHKVVVELANETWNFTFPFVNANIKASQMQGLTGNTTTDSWILRSKAVFDIVKSVFDEIGRGSEVLLAMPWQLGNIDTILTRCRALGVDIDVCSSAPYFRPAASTAMTTAFNSYDTGQLGDLILFDMLRNTTGTSAAIRNDGAAWAKHKLLTGKDVELIHYEGGLDSMIPQPWDPITNGAARNADIMYDPNTYNVCYDLIYAYYLMAGGTGKHGFINFNSCQAPDGPLNIAGGTYWAIWGDTEWDGQPAGYGDGRNGSVDNRLFLAVQGQAGSKHPTVSQALNCVSVRRQADIDYNLAYTNYNTPPTNVDVPHRITLAGRPKRRRGSGFVNLSVRVTSETPPPPTPPELPKVGRRALPIRRVL